MRLVLASASPRRKMVLEGAGYEFIVREPSVREIAEGPPHHIAVENARAKARSAVSGPGDLIMGCDTVVHCGGILHGKPGDRKDARCMIESQLGVPSEVVSGLCLIDSTREREVHGYEVSTVILEGDPSAIEGYLDLELWQGKAGAFGIQDGGDIRARVLEGEVDNVVGLPMTLLRRLLSLMRFDYPERTPSEG